MEDHKSEIEDWDLGAGMYISFYLLRSSLQEESTTINELVQLSLEKLQMFVRAFHISRLHVSAE